MHLTQITKVFNGSIDMFGAKEQMDKKVSHATWEFKKSLSLASRKSENRVFLHRRYASFTTEGICL